MDTEQIKRLYEALHKEGFSFIDLHHQGNRIRMVIDSIRKTSDEPKAKTITVADNRIETHTPTSNLVNINSERVGIFSFGKSPVVLHQVIEKGAVVGFIKGISFQDQVKSPVKGKISTVHVREGDIVEFGRLLFIVELEKDS